LNWFAATFCAGGFGDQGPYTGDLVQWELRELVSKRFSRLLFVPFLSAVYPNRRRQVGNGFEVPNDEVSRGHGVIRAKSVGLLQHDIGKCAGGGSS
jgi:hypothetical protein